MAAHILRLGNLDLSSYVRVASEDGLDPLDSSGFLDPQFSTSVISEGQPLISVTQNNREMIFPLFLNNASMAGLTQLMQQITNEIQNTKPLRIEWREQGATNSTFFDVTFARFDPEYNYRRIGNGGKKWLAGKLTVFAAPPYGHTGTTRIVATGVASGSALVIPIPSALEGDADAQLRVDVRHALSRGWDGDQLAISVLPNPSWSPIINASQFIAPATSGIVSASVGIASGAPGGIAYGFKIDPTWYSGLNPSYTAYRERLFSFGLNASTYTGNVRVLAAVRAQFWKGLTLSLTDNDGNKLNNGIVATGWHGYSLVDLGRISIPSSIDGATIAYSVGMDSSNINNESPVAAPATAKRWQSGAQVGANNAPWDIEIAQLYVLPEDQTQVFLDSKREAFTSISFMDASPLDTAAITVPFTDAYGEIWNATKCQIAAEGIAATNAAASSDAVIYPPQVDHGNYAFECEISAKPFYTGGASSNPFSVTRAGAMFYGAGFVSVGRNGSGNYLSLGGFTFAGAPSAAASFANIATQPLGLGQDRMLLRGRMQGNTISASLEFYNYHATIGLSTYTTLASISITDPSLDGKGNLQIGIGNHTMRWLRAHTTPSYAHVPSGVFTVDTTDRTAQYLNAGGSYQRDLSNQRGGHLTIPAPTAASVFVLHQMMDGVSGQTSAVVYARERFQFFR